RQIPVARLMIIGHGEPRPALEQLSGHLGIAEAVIWAGYHEEDLAEHYRAADLLLFTERGSDEGHRAVLEAMACGVPPVVAPVAGIHALLRGFEERLIAGNRSSAAMAMRALALLESGGAGNIPLRSAMAAHSEQFGYDGAARRLLDIY
ncbi:MAG: capsular biosynthesis protein, partial [Acidobacteria bacterium]|nr:capsular biosynthesis protein [Acidobacteriota bacterium]